MEKPFCRVNTSFFNQGLASRKSRGNSLHCFRILISTPEKGMCLLILFPCIGNQRNHSLTKLKLDGLRHRTGIQGIFFGTEPGCTGSTVKTSGCSISAQAPAPGYALGGAHRRSRQLPGGEPKKKEISPLEASLGRLFVEGTAFWGGLTQTPT